MPSDTPCPVQLIIRLPDEPDQALPLDFVTDRIRARREVLKMGRFAEKFKAAQIAIDALDDATESDLDKIHARTLELHKKREDVMTRKLVSLDERMGVLTEFGKDLEEFDGKNDHGNAGAVNGSAYVGTNAPK